MWKKIKAFALWLWQKLKACFTTNKPGTANARKAPPAKQTATQAITNNLNLNGTGKLMTSSKANAPLSQAQLAKTPSAPKKEVVRQIIKDTGFLAKFIQKQDEDNTYETALKEMKAGHKRTHWIWYIFPQLQGLGRSEESKRYGLEDIDQACAYLANPKLFERYSNIVSVVQNKLITQSIPASVLMGSDIDLNKLISSLTLFREASRRLLLNNNAPEKLKHLNRDCNSILAKLGECRYTLQHIAPPKSTHRPK